MNIPKDVASLQGMDSTSHHQLSSELCDVDNGAVVTRL